MGACPVDTPDTIPVVPVTVAAVVLPLLHVPPAGLSLSVVVMPVHTLLLPETGTGVVLIITVVVAAQPVGKV